MILGGCKSLQGIVLLSPWRKSSKNVSKQENKAGHRGDEVQFYSSLSMTRSLSQENKVSLSLCGAVTVWSQRAVHWTASILKMVWSVALQVDFCINTEILTNSLESII